MMTVFVNLTGILLIGIIAWWFWYSKLGILTTKVEDFIEIKVKNGVYTPANIQVQVNHHFILRFIREDANPCAETIIFSSLNISKHLPLGEPVDISLSIKNIGEYEFTCQMGMYRGKLNVI